MSMCNNRN